MTTAQDNSFSFSYQNLSAEPIEHILNIGNVIYVLGANGSGKSALMTKLCNQNQNKPVKRIAAHRQNWFRTNTLELTSANKIQAEQNIINADAQLNSRHMDDYSPQRSQITISDLINATNQYNKNIAEAALASDQSLIEKLKKKDSPLIKLNRLLKISNLPIVITIEEDKIFAAKKNSNLYGIEKLSDGERNAILLIVDVLTAKPNTLFVIDEPERHLHRSIVSPLLSSLFVERPDCVFVIATHDIELPLNNPKADILLVKECAWQAEQVVGWDTNKILATQIIEEGLKRDILGARRIILFIEGNNQNSLDHHIYRMLFPEISVIAQGNCTAVEKAVKGVNETNSINWIKAFGLIDKDDRQKYDLDKLKSKNIYALPCSSVESLYYNSFIIGKIAKIRGKNNEAAIALETKAYTVITKKIENSKDKMCALVCERRINSQIKNPTWKDIQSKNVFSQKTNLKTIFDREKKILDKLINNKDIDGLINRYPIKKTGMLKDIAQALKFKDCNEYEDFVRKLIIDDSKVYSKLRNMLKDLTAAIMA